MAASRSALRARLRRARVLVGAGLVIVTAGLSAAVAGVIPGRAIDHPPTVDPFSEPLTAFPPVSTSGNAPAATTRAPIAVSGAS